MKEESTVKQADYKDDTRNRHFRHRKDKQEVFPI